MVRSVQHEMLAKPNHDEAARQRFVVALKQGLTRELRSRNRALFDAVVSPEFARKHTRSPSSRAEIRAAMSESTPYRSWSAMHRAAQELMWESVGDTVQREQARLGSTAHRLASQQPMLGSLTLDPDFVPPRSVTAVDIHLQPGGFALDLGAGDTTAGALYESGGNLFAFGHNIGRTDSKAAHVQRYIAAEWPGFKPRRILDMGCSAGSASVPYVSAFPDAKVHAIDVGAGMLRYAHARAQSLGAAIHFHQMDCAAAKFPDAHFELIVSHNLMHEIPATTRRGMLRETWRLLAAGGVFVHQDVPLRFDTLSEFDKFELSWDTRNNNEPFWEVFAEADLQADLRAAGVPGHAARIGNLPAAPGSLPWLIVSGVKP